MEEQLSSLVDKVWDLHTSAAPSHRTLLAIAGIPGSGKTTLASTLVRRLNDRYVAQHPALAPQNGPLAVVVGMDGFHLTRKALDGLVDPVRAHARRGAAFTFDAPSYLSLVRTLRQPLTPEQGSVWAPTFDHAVKDPVECGVEVGKGARIVVFEGNYVALEGEGEGDGCGDVGDVSKGGEEEDRDVKEINTGKDEDENETETEVEPETDDQRWAAAKALMDFVVFVEVEEDVARRRLMKRHVAAGIAKDEEEAGRRADENDLVNGREVVRRRGRVDLVLWSRDDVEW